MEAQTPTQPNAGCSPATTIVAAVGEADVGRLVTVTALRVARTWPGSRLHLVRVLTDQLGGAAHAGKLYGYERGRLARYARLARAAPCIEVRGHLLFGEAATSLAHFAERVEASLLVVGTHDAGPTLDVAFGSVADALLRRAPCPALLVRPRQPGTPEVCGGSTCAGCPHLRGAFFDTTLPCRDLGIRGPQGGS
ncbi:MAG: universal stress protein [Polyangiaceae bacterium]|nr:universal stress protein [Polyangiaceae bacterium]